MSNHAEYLAGWIDTTIHDFLTEIDEPASGMTYALVTCLDSSPDVVAALELGERWGLAGKCKVVGRGLLMTTHQLLAAERRHRLFFGFDEVWFFPKPNVAPKPEALAVVGPDPIDPGEVWKYKSWMGSTNCSLGLGDGTGMNYWLRVRGVAKLVVAALNESQSHTLDGSPEPG